MLCSCCVAMQTDCKEQSVSAISDYLIRHELKQFKFVVAGFELGFVRCYSILAVILSLIIWLAWYNLKICHTLCSLTSSTAQFWAPQYKKDIKPLKRL